MIGQLLMVLALAPGQAPARPTEDQAIEAARRALVRQIDPMLPREPFETRLRDIVGPRPAMK